MRETNTLFYVALTMTDKIGAIDSFDTEAELDEFAIEKQLLLRVNMKPV